MLNSSLTYGHTLRTQVIQIAPIILTYHMKHICITDPSVSVFMYHYVRDDDPNDTPSTRDLSVTPERFEAHMRAVAGIRDAGRAVVMNAEDFLRAYTTRCFPHRHIWLMTSDDGWIDSATHLAPRAEQYRIPFLFGIISSKVGTP